MFLFQILSVCLSAGVCWLLSFSMRSFIFIIITICTIILDHFIVEPSTIVAGDSIPSQSRMYTVPVCVTVSASVYTLCIWIEPGALDRHTERRFVDNVKQGPFGWKANRTPFTFQHNLSTIGFVHWPLSHTCTRIRWLRLVMLKHIHEICQEVNEEEIER